MPGGKGATVSFFHCGLSCWCSSLGQIRFCNNIIAGGKKIAQAVQALEILFMDVPFSKKCTCAKFISKNIIFIRKSEFEKKKQIHDDMDEMTIPKKEAKEGIRNQRGKMQKKLVSCVFLIDEVQFGFVSDVAGIQNWLPMRRVREKAPGNQALRSLQTKLQKFRGCWAHPRFIHQASFQPPPGGRYSTPHPQGSTPQVVKYPPPSLF